MMKKENRSNYLHIFKNRSERKLQTNRDIKTFYRKILRTKSFLKHFKGLKAQLHGIACALTSCWECSHQMPPACGPMFEGASKDLWRSLQRFHAVKEALSAVGCASLAIYSSSPSTEVPQRDSVRDLLNFPDPQNHRKTVLNIPKTTPLRPQMVPKCGQTW